MNRHEHLRRLREEVNRLDREMHEAGQRGQGRRWEELNEELRRKRFHLNQAYAAVERWTLRHIVKRTAQVLYFLVGLWLVAITFAVVSDGWPQRNVPRDIGYVRYLVPSGNQWSGVAAVVAVVIVVRAWMTLWDKWAEPLLLMFLGKAFSRRRGDGD